MLRGALGWQAGERGCEHRTEQGGGAASAASSAAQVMWVAFFFLVLPPLLPSSLLVKVGGSDWSNQSGRGLLFAYRSGFFPLSFL